MFSIALSVEMWPSIGAIFFSSFLTIVAAIEPFPHVNSKPFDDGDFGPYPNRTYISAPTLTSPQFIIQSNEKCDKDSYDMISLRGDRVKLSGQSPMIHDHNGNLVWMNTTYGETFGLGVQKYKGKDYLTFWQGDDVVGGHGEGYYFMVSWVSLAFARLNNLI